MAKVLVVANETLGGRTLLNFVKQRHARGDHPAFVVVAPMARPKAGLVVYDDAARGAAQVRVDDMVGRLRDEGIEAVGDVMDPDPFNAVMDAVGEYSPDEIVVSTHPETRSGWLRRDLIERVTDASGLPVEHVVVDLDAEREDVTQTLVVANQTVEGAPLFGLLKGKAAEKPHRFIVVVPQAGGGGEGAAGAQTRLQHVLEHMRSEGLTGTGAIGDPDPYTAIMNALQFYRVDEIVISTHPETRSGWLRNDLIERVRRATAKPVEHVVVDVEAARS
ncbi:MAG: hypothetical protein JWN32_469 [Solirubrobacterales bacterium]|nr:hypothetical protein [Solirubrobacterales bacterium]